MRIFSAYPSIHYEPVHQPRMKVFTVGLEDKEKAKQADVEKSDMTKIPIDSSSSTPAPSPRPIVIPRAAPRKPFKGCGVISWLVAAFFVILLCLTISEIAYNRQRDQAFLRLKWAELRQRMLGYELMSQAQQQIQPVDERLAFNRRNDMEALPLRETPVVTVAQQIDNSHENDKSLESSSESDSRLSFLRALLERIREKAQDMGLDGDMQVHVIEVKPVNTEHMSQQSWDDGFGEVAVPKQFFPSQREEDYQDYDSMHRPALSPLFWPQPQFNQDNMRPMPWQLENRFPEWNQPWNNQRAGRRFDNAYGGQGFDGPNWNMADDFNGRPQFDQQHMDMPFPMQQQPSQWNNFMSSPQFMANDWHSAPARDFAPQMPSEPSIGQQNQFPFQNQNSPVVPAAATRPWYMSSGDDQAWAQTWNNDWKEHKQDEMPFQPHPAASSNPSEKNFHWVDRSTAERGEDSEGIDNFRAQERFNIPVDIAADADPVSVDKNEKDASRHGFRANTWQHTQPDEAIDTAPAAVPPPPPPVLSDDKDFLPIRHDDEPIQGDKVQPSGPMHDDFEKKFDSPFFQIDDPSSFRH